MRNRTVFISTLSFTLLAVFVCVGCSHSGKWHTLKISETTELRWRPETPKIGDLVELSARYPFNASDSNVSFLADPSGAVLESRPPEPLSGGFEERSWSFRATAAGEWTWGTAGKKQILFAVDSIAGSENELKKLDAQYLWTGKGSPTKKTSTQAAGQGTVRP